MSSRVNSGVATGTTSAIGVGSGSQARHNSVMEDLHMRQIAAGRKYETLSSKLQRTMLKTEYNAKAKFFYMSKQVAWNEVPLLKSICSESDYYTELVTRLKLEQQLFPYHISSFVCKIQRITPFRYYLDILIAALKAEKAYDSIPNFTAADIVRVVGVGRNEFIDILNKCRAKFIWKLNKAFVPKDLLPSQPKEIVFKPWWIVEAINVTNDDIRRSKPHEVKVVDNILNSTEGRLPVCDVTDLDALLSLYKRGLVYIDVPITSDDKISIPPLENFVSNKSNDDDESTEGVLYSVFVASSERASVGDLAMILEMDLEKVLQAVSLACRLGFAEKIISPRIHKDDSGNNSSSQRKIKRQHRLSLGIDGNDSLNMSQLQTRRDSDMSVSAPPPNSDEEDDEDNDDDEVYHNSHQRQSFAAILVDTTLTSFLMMGNLSAGLKRHAVTLFEGGRLSDANVTDFYNELSSVESSDLNFEGTVEEIVEHVQSLGIMLKGIWSLKIPEKDRVKSKKLEASSNSIKESMQEVTPMQSPVNLIDVDSTSHDENAIDPESPSSDSHEYSTIDDFHLKYTNHPCEGSSLPSAYDDDRSKLVTTPIVVGGIDVIRVESMSSLPREVCRKVLQRDYSLILETAPLRALPLPMLPSDSQTTVVGLPGIELQLLWKKLALHVTAENGPETIIIPAGTRLREVPDPILGAAHVALWPWRSQNGPPEPKIINTTHLLAAINNYLESSAVLVQRMPDAAIDASGRKEIIVTASIPLPVRVTEKQTIVAFRSNTFEKIEISFEKSMGIKRLLDQWELNKTIGILEIAHTGNSEDEQWLPHDLHVGIPLFYTKLCESVMDRALDEEFFTIEGLTGHKKAVENIRLKVHDLMKEYALGRDSRSSEFTFEDNVESLQPRFAILVSNGIASEYSLSKHVQGGLTLQEILYPKVEFPESTEKDVPSQIAGPIDSLI